MAPMWYLCQKVIAASGGITTGSVCTSLWSVRPLAGLGTYADCSPPRESVWVRQPQAPGTHVATSDTNPLRPISKPSTSTAEQGVGCGVAVLGGVGVAVGEEGVAVTQPGLCSPVMVRV